MMSMDFILLQLSIKVYIALRVGFSRTHSCQEKEPGMSIKSLKELEKNRFLFYVMLGILQGGLWQFLRLEK